MLMQQVSGRGRNVYSLTLNQLPHCWALDPKDMVQGTILCAKPLTRSLERDPAVT